LQGENILSGSPVRGPDGQTHTRLPIIVDAEKPHASRAEAIERWKKSSSVAIGFLHFPVEARRPLSLLNFS
jgi:hypothetical protein